MMKKTIKIAFAGAMTMMLFTGCIKEVEPTDRALEDQVTLESLVQGIPAALVMAGSTGYGQPWDFSLPAVHLAMESMTGDLVVTGNIGYDWFQQWGTNDALGPEYAVGAIFWHNYYSWIMTANKVIRLIDTSETTAMDISDKIYLGYAYVYRAMFYLDLVRMYEFKENNYTKGDNVLGLGVPVVLPETTEAEAKRNPRAKVDDIYEQVIFPDLERAEELLAGYTAPDKYSISLPLVYGLKARAWLERGTAKNDPEAYREAAYYARKAITDSGRTPLTQEEWEDPSNGFNNAEANNAWIWGLALPSESVINLLCFTAHMSTENEWSAYGNDVGRGINKNLYNSINNRDFRKHSWLAPDRSSYKYKSCRPDADEYFTEELADYANIKFRPAQGKYEDYKIGGAADHCCMRVEEMYFIEAEAEAHVTGVAEGVRLLNEFMTSYRMTEGAVYDCTSRVNASIENFTNELLLQKRIEFWGEGIIMFDMKRLNISTKRGYVGTNAPASYRLNTDGRAPYWNFAIPRGEVQNNTALSNQNNPDPSSQVPLWKG